MPLLRSLSTLLLLLGACVIAEPASTTASPAAPHVAADAWASYTTKATHTVKVEGHPIAVWSKPATTPWGTIVLVHGRTWSAQPDFDLQVPGESRSLMDALVAEGLTVYAVDQRGYGATPRDASEWLTPDRAAADLAAVLQWVGQRHPDLPPPALLGWSLGSIVSQLTAQRHPERISALVLYGYPRQPGAIYEPDPVPLPAPERRVTTAEAAAEDFIVPGSISQAGIDGFVAAALEADPVRMDWRASDQWNALDPAAVTTPTLVIHGERDPYAPVENQARLFTGLASPDREWVIVAGGDHAAHLEDCGPRFVHAVVGFLRRPH